MSFFDAFYFMSYTATTIGFGELPHTFTDAQRMWVIASIYLTVVGWAYALGSLFALLQDRAFRDAIARQRFIRRVARVREPFLLIAGYGRTGELLGRSLDALGRRFVVLDDSQQRIDSLELESYHVRRSRPGRAMPAIPDHLGVAGLGQRQLRGRARADQQRRGQPGRHHVGRAAATGPAGDRAHRVAGRGGADARLRYADGGEPLRPVRRPPSARVARARLLPAARPGWRAGSAPTTAAWPPAGRGPLGDLRVRPLRSRAGGRPARRGLAVTVIDPAAPGRRRRREPSWSATAPSRASWPRTTSRKPSASSPARTTTPPTCR